ncbi:hypothetical protein F4778DRAFT_719685 [Xylariomycetidae sp. FL2044]|nr:hypothetical protein F4778DRAFT_719685 [Xylariomycetidae sp. FL2044]
MVDDLLAPLVVRRSIISESITVCSPSNRQAIQAMTTSAPALPDPRVVVTATAKDTGLSTFQSDRTLPPFRPFGPHASAFTVIDNHATLPVSNNNNNDNQDEGGAPPALPRCPPAGVNFSIADFPPRYSAPLHRTLSLDYGIVLAGEIALELDGGGSGGGSGEGEEKEEKILRAGDVVVQRGANHVWHNRTDAYCRVAFVMIGAEKIRLESGEELGETVFKR